MHVTVEGRSKHEERSAPTGGCRTILQDGEHSLVGSIALTVVGHEEHLVSTPLVGTLGVQSVTAVDDLLGIFSSLVPLRSTCVDLCIQIEASQKHPAGTLGSTAIAIIGRLHGLGIHQVGFNIQQLILNPFVCFLASDLLRLSQSLGKRNVAKGIHQHVVLQGTDETYLCHLLGVAAFTYLIDVTVAVVDTRGQTIVVHVHHRVSSVVLVEVESGNTGVTPAADGLIGRQFVGVPQLADESGCTAVVSVDVRVTVGTAVTGQGQVGIALQIETIQTYLC